MGTLSSFLLLIIVGCASASYSDAFVRKYFPTIFASTEAKNARHCLDKVFRSYTLKRHLNLICDETRVNTCSGLTLASHDDKAIVVAFRGTKTWKQLTKESEDTIFKNKTRWPGGGNVGVYFARAFFTLWHYGMKEDVKTLHAKYPSYEVWIGGHSLGGSMATLASSYLASIGIFQSSQIKLITFGEPRTGDKEFADVLDELVPYSYRIVHKRDIVPHLPLYGLKGYRHHKNEIWYDNDMSKAIYKECDEQESIFCSNSHSPYEVVDHHRYFGVFMTNYGSRGCTGDPAN